MRIDESMIAASRNRVKLSLGAASRRQTSVTSDLKILEILRKSYENLMKSYRKRLKTMLINVHDLGPQDPWNPIKILWKSHEIPSKTFENHDTWWINESIMAAGWNRRTILWKSSEIYENRWNSRLLSMESPSQLFSAAAQGADNVSSPWSAPSSPTTADSTKKISKCATINV